MSVSVVWKNTTFYLKVLNGLSLKLHWNMVPYYSCQTWHSKGPLEKLEKRFGKVDTSRYFHGTKSTLHWSSKQFMLHPICIVGTQSRKSSSLDLSEKFHTIILMKLFNVRNCFCHGGTSRINLWWSMPELKCFTLTGKRKCTIIFEEKKKPLHNSWKHNVYDKISYKSFT